MHKNSLIAVLAFASIVLLGGTSSAGVATSGISKANVAPAASIVQEAGWRARRYRRCVRRCVRRGNGWDWCRWQCSRWWW